MSEIVWDGKPCPPRAERLALPGGRILEDAVVWPNFCQEALSLDPRDIWSALLALPSWPSDREIPFRPDGGDPHWINGNHRALKMRGHELRRSKIWCQTGYADGLRRYGYTGWQWRVANATHAVECIPRLNLFAARLNAGMIRSGHRPHNHFIVTRYDDGADNIGYHSDKDADFAEGSYFVVIKLGPARDFAFREPGATVPFWTRELAAGTAVFVRCKAPGAANDIVQHGVPPTSAAVGVSGSIVSRCIDTLIPWPDVAKRCRP